MKYNPDTYARVFWEVKPEPRQFLSVVAKNGDLQRVDKIVDAIEAHAVHAAGGHTIALEFARETEFAKQFTFFTHDRIRTIINPALVAGVRITIDGEQELDMSLQRKLNKLWPMKS